MSNIQLKQTLTTLMLSIWNSNTRNELANELSSLFLKLVYPRIEAKIYLKTHIRVHYKEHTAYANAHDARGINSEIQR